jgi:3-oxoacyl-[acyl-carrier protein] reductase
MNSETILSGKIAIVTGGCRGIGKAIVEKLANCGARVFALDYTLPKEGEIFIEDCAIAELISCVQCDVSNEESVKNAIGEVLTAGSKIDILVNNAGITRDGLVVRMSENDWDSVLNINLKGTFLCSKAVAMPMMKQRSGRIINISSIVGITGNAGQANYSASKAGVIGLTKSLAKELGSRNILVNCIAPGFVLTQMTDVLTDEQKKAYTDNIPLKRAAVPADVANAVAFFCGELSSYITGQILHVDGGLAM